MAQLDATNFPVQSRSLSERIPFRHVDLALLGAALALAVYGVLMVYSATHRGQAIRSLDPTFFVKRQALFALIGLIVMAAVALFDYRHLRIWAPFIYGFFVLMLIVVKLPHVGHAALGAQRSFSVLGFQLSPSLFTRIALILMLAAYLSGIHGSPSL